ncbi:MAG: inositol monophosphatase family protein [Gammaproteobacteria bacterium]|nr:inositol monophosphatase family protein [Gammaproteobacteria bacterium]
MFVVIHALPDLDLLTDIVRRAAREELLPRFTRVIREHKADGSILTEADLAMDARLHAELNQTWPDIAFLSEEMDAAEQRLLLAAADRPLWCLDPLDGTSNFAAGIPFFGVSLALLCDGQAQLGLIYDPIRDECFTSRRGEGAWLNGQRLTTAAIGLPLKQCIALIDFKRLTAALRQRLIETPPFHSQRNFGSCALEWAWLAAGRGHVYLHGGQKLWDFAAGSRVLTEAGGTSFTLDGAPVFVARLETRSAVASPDPRLAQTWLDWLRNPA